VMRQTVGCSLSGLPSESPYVLVDGAEPNDSLSARRAYIGSLGLGPLKAARWGR
jgi:hypothetical protein